MSWFIRKPAELLSPSETLPGRSAPLRTSAQHLLFGVDQKAEAPGGMEEAFFAMGCFWGVERLFWQQPGVWLTAAGYQGGVTLNPTYEEVCSGLTNHTESVRVVWDPAQISFAALLKIFWESHNPTQGFRQGNDTGTQYRSALYVTTPGQLEAAEASRALYQHRLMRAGQGFVTTEIAMAPEFYYAEDYHQQYLAKNPDGYCGLKGTGVSCPIAPPAAPAA
ncbi:peptide-methionine (S)-S-oxide reductase MsrA [Falsigemmobacter faecalis]|uniref:Peptide methionine sulfoxide reductase MsrA n=1 Tax=Falsigemmobacter faecalis TaxID=2488730 RepID=A0A3P3DGT7_9RHOB|nr:peptide-methionine (S)-S-oxide reductase MsrA [Falsigemmobacter faecalis]RRH73487.1 peptide-methionine (S)-S-oxide reductase MsrA [Falsigemmobacter faecalis]